MDANTLDDVKDFLRALCISGAYREVDGCFEDAEGMYQSDSSPAAEVAREMCRELLEAADANGMGGCRLCRS